VVLVGENAAMRNVLESTFPKGHHGHASEKDGRWDHRNCDGKEGRQNITHCNECASP
jgi:hypothetical protein